VKRWIDSLGALDRRLGARRFVGVRRVIGAKSFGLMSVSLAKVMSGVGQMQRLDRPECEPSSLLVPATSAMVEIALLRPADSPRRVTVDEEHVRNLAQMGVNLPPILVHRPTMRIIDGMHRVRAATLNGENTIRANFVDCPENDVFVLAVKTNIAHGLPLSLVDREAAAARVLGTHPMWSDRSIAEVTGLSAKTVCAIRRRSTDDSQQSNMRYGRDGRARPLDGTAGRLRASAIIAAHPETSLRQIAKEAGVSIGTARDVRQRMGRGEDVVVKPKAKRAGNTTNWPAVRRRLKEDPVLRYSAQGRDLLRWLEAHAIDPVGSNDVLAAVPPHWASTVAEYARWCANEWLEVAKDIEKRHRGTA
jgi:ParB-like chromosome segregation protein Spo0J